MVLPFISRSIWFAAVALLLVACPGSTNKVSNTNTLAAPAKLLDSASLISHLAFLTTAEAAGRESATPGNLLAQQYIVKKFDSLQVENSLQPFKLRSDTTKTGNNVIGIIKGTKYPDSYIAITAHYDHLGIHNGAIYYGADDNASGTANLLALAQYFKKHPPQHSLLIVAFDAEEKGLTGSKYFVNNLPLLQSSILMNLNMDMISRNDKNEIYACGTFHYPFLKKYIDSVQALTSVSIRFGHDEWTTQSDHHSFHVKKIPFIYFGVEDHADYHKPSDTFDKINKSFYYQVCGMIANTLILIDKQEKLQ